MRNLASGRYIAAVLYLLTPFIIALVVASAVVISYRTRRIGVIVMIWLAVVLIAVLLRPGSVRMLLGL